MKLTVKVEIEGAHLFRLCLQQINMKMSAMSNM